MDPSQVRPGPNPVASMTVELLANMSPDALDTLPFGVIELDPAGVVLFYNAAEAAAARRTAADVLGRNFWEQVATCSNGPQVRGKVEALLEREIGSDTSLEFAFKFPWSTRHVAIRALRGVDRMWLLIEERPEPV